RPPPDARRAPHPGVRSTTEATRAPVPARGGRSPLRHRYGTRGPATGTREQGPRGNAMPELPEVEVVRRGLLRWVAHRTVADAEVLHPRAVRRHLAGADDFAHRLKGHRIGTPSRRGKYLWLPLEDTGQAILAHLGMSGQLLVQPHTAPDEKHLRVRIRFTDARDTELRFVDQRTF